MSFIGLLYCETLEKEMAEVLSPEEFPLLITSSYTPHCRGKEKSSDPVEGPLSDLIRTCNRIIILGCGCMHAICLPSVPESVKIIIPDLFRDILLPESFLDRKRKEGAYCMVPVNFSRFSDYFLCQGFNKNALPDFISDSIQSVLLADTECDPIDDADLWNVREQFKVPVTTIPVGTKPIRRYLKNEYLKWQLEQERAEYQRALSEAHKKTADYAMMVDLLGEITMVQQEDEVIRRIFDLFSILFSPQNVGFLPIVQGKPGTYRTHPVSGSVVSDEMNTFLNGNDEYTFTRSKEGFFLRVSHDNATVGILALNGFAMPQYLHNYLDLGRFIAKVCGLAITNARIYQQLDKVIAQLNDEISERKKTEDKLTKILRDHQTILENVPSLILFKDTQNRYIKVNPAAAKIIGKPIQEIEGKTFSELFPERKDEYSLADSEVIQSKIPKMGVLEEYTDPDGTHMWMQTDTVPLLNESGEVIGLLVVSTDITDRKLAKDAISRANHKLNLLSGITRHDIGNELQIIFGYLELAKMTGIPPELTEYFTIIDESAHHIERQIAFTRDYQDIGVHSPVWQDVSEIIHHTTKSIHLDPIQVIVDISGVEIFADPLIVKVFFNLMDNAKRYGEKITHIRFFWKIEEQKQSIVCEDDGVGIPEEFKSKIFNREYFKHTGFGLNLSREILDITGLTIQETGVPGVGARFEIIVPEGRWRYTR